MSLNSNDFQLWITSIFSLKLCKKEKEIKRIYIFAVVFHLIPGVKHIQ